MTDRIQFASAGAVPPKRERTSHITTAHVDIVFDGPPGPDGPRFVEVENAKGQSIKFGEWVKRDDGFTVLRFRNPDQMARLLTTLREVETYLEERQDADDGIPNEAMSLLIEVRGAIAAAGA